MNFVQNTVKFRKYKFRNYRSFFFCVSNLRGLYSEGFIFGILRYEINSQSKCAECYIYSWTKGPGLFSYEFMRFARLEKKKRNFADLGFAAGRMRFAWWANPVQAFPRAQSSVTDGPIIFAPVYFLLRPLPDHRVPVLRPGLEQRARSTQEDPELRLASLHGTLPEIWKVARLLRQILLQRWFGGKCEPPYQFAGNGSCARNEIAPPFF